MTRRTLTVEQAFQDFIDNILPGLFPKGTRKGNREYNRIKQAQYSMQKGELTADRLKGIFSKHAPDRYTFVEHVSVVVTEPE